MRSGRYELETGQFRAKNAAGALGVWTGLKAAPVRALKRSADTGPDSTGKWEAVGEASWKDISREEDVEDKDGYHLLIVDQDGNAKACSCEMYDLRTVLKLAERVPLPVAHPGNGELWRALEKRKGAAAGGSRASYQKA